MTESQVQAASTAAQAEPALRVEGVTAGYGGGSVIFDVSIEVPQAGIVAVLGSNGAGKSTLLRCISGLVRPEKGSVRANGQVLSGMSPTRIARAGVAHVPEGRGVFGELTVSDNLELGIFGSSDRSRAVAESRRHEVYELFPRLRERERQLAGTLSGGEQQMLAIGRGLMAKPRVLMLDEPSLGLAPVRVQEVMARLVEVKKAGVAVLVVDQNVAAALSIAEYVYVLRGGRIIQQGSPDELRSESLLRHAYLGDEN